jgi:hypothetical protein
VLRCLVIATFIAVCLPGAVAAGAAKDKKAEASYALVAGTVFRESGLSLAGAEVELTAAGQPDPARKLKKMKAISDARGEFSFRVPPIAGAYRLTVRAAGYETQEKPASVNGEERVDVFFSLQRASE